jgi:hypothetical protein
MYKHRERIGEFITEIEEDEEAELLYYWTSDDYPADSDGQAYYVRFDNGYYDFAIKDQLNLNVRPVRDIAYRGK